MYVVLVVVPTRVHEPVSDVDVSTAYDTTAEPPFEVGADHVTVACAFPAAPLNDVGAPGVDAGVTDVEVALAPLPAAFTAMMRMTTGVPFVRPVTTAVVPVTNVSELNVVPPSVEDATL